MVAGWRLYAALVFELELSGLSATALARLPDDDQAVAAPVSHILDRELRRRVWHTGPKRTGTKKVLRKLTGCRPRRFAPWLPRNKLRHSWNHCPGGSLFCLLGFLLSRASFQICWTSGFVFWFTWSSSSFTCKDRSLGADV